MSRDDFVARLRERSRLDAPAGPVIVATGIRSDGALVVLYREADGAPLLGRPYDLDAYSASFRPPKSPKALADIAYTEDLCDPSGSGIRLKVDWADGLVPHPGEIGWLLTYTERDEFERAGLLA